MVLSKEIEVSRNECPMRRFNTPSQSANLLKHPEDHDRRGWFSSPTMQPREPCSLSRRTARVGKKRRKFQSLSSFNASTRS